jgi:NAD(P)-dependent dehydrogenase (short-subunit alcohol dehydrogenase family)
LLISLSRDGVSAGSGFTFSNKHAVLDKTFAVNIIGPLALTQALLPNILKSSSSRIGNMSSRVGSVGDNTSGGSYAYRAFKGCVEQHQQERGHGFEDEGVVVVIMHPGYVRTGLSPWDHDLPEAVEPEEAASKLWKVLMSKSNRRDRQILA